MPSQFIRTASASDNEIVTDFILMAGDGIFEQLFDSSMPGVNAKRALATGLRLGVGPYSHRNAFLLCDNGKLPGCILGFPGRKFGLPKIARWSLPNSRLSPLDPLFACNVEDSFYINTLAVSSSERRRGFGKLLLDHANELAIKGGFKYLTLHVWADNLAALKLYKKWGFNIEAEMEVPRTKYLRRRGPLLLAKSPVREGKG